MFAGYGTSVRTNAWRRRRALWSERLALAAPVVSQADRPQTQILGDAEDVFQVLFRVFGA